MNGRFSAAFAGTGRLVRLAVRRDRVQLPVWLIALTLTMWASAASVIGLYGDERSRLSYATSNVGSAVSRVFNGPVGGSSVGAITAAETMSLLSVLVALMSIFAVVRHTRQNEETGRSEMLAAGIVGRHAALTAALLVVVAANLVLAALLAIAGVASGLPVTGSIALGLALGGVGAVFAGVAAVTAQIAESTRAASGLAGAVLGLAFLLRAVGDAMADPDPSGTSATSAWPSLLSPLGWAVRVRPYSADDWWPLGLSAALLVASVFAAFRLTVHRDVGTGMLPVRPGPAAAARSLLSPLGLAWRLQRGLLYGWAAGILALGLAFGAVGDEADSLIGDNADVAEVMAQLGGGGDIVDTYFGAMLALLSLVIACYTVQSLLRMRSEETGPLESMLAGAVSRPRWMMSHIVCALGGTLALLAVLGATTGLGYAVISGEWADVLPLIGAALAQAPAIAALAGFGIAVLGALPRWSVPLLWGGLAACLLTGQLGGLLELPQLVMNISPFTHTPQLPSADFNATPLVALTVVALALIAGGMAAFRRRDLTLA